MKNEEFKAAVKSKMETWLNGLIEGYWSEAEDTGLDEEVTTVDEAYQDIVLYILNGGAE